ncbi:MAG: hypothetical protein K0Q73_9202 [Paenibacillus sp.]|jgi:hypothetical protein|nr:hypothetical protein [Paenibacillus sp.]
MSANVGKCLVTLLRSSGTDRMRKSNGPFLLFARFPPGSGRQQNNRKKQTKTVFSFGLLFVDALSKSNIEYTCKHCVFGGSSFWLGSPCWQFTSIFNKPILFHTLALHDSDTGTTPINPAWVPGRDEIKLFL